MTARLGAALLALAAITSPLTAAPLPNVVIVFTDDFGYGDLGCYGAKGYQTPHLDRLAKEGVRFTDFYVSQPVCSASRASLMTGCYANRVGIHGALGPNARHGLNPTETTLAEVFKTKGYATGMAGKWHLGHHREFLPLRQGFDSYLGLPYSNDMWPHRPDLKPGSYPTLKMFDGDAVVDDDVTADDQRQLTTKYAERAVEFIAANKDRPFFFYLAHSMPHVPLFVSDKYQGKTERGLFGDVVSEVDWSVGQVLKALDDHKIADNTLVIFASDNGPWLNYGDHAGSAGGLREGKGTVWEGGVREPFLARWPGHIPAGSVCREPAMTIDILPTMAKLIGADLPERKIDGLDILPLLEGKPGAKSPHEVFYFYYHTGELQAVRAGPWKLILPHSYRTMHGQKPGGGGKPGQYRQVKLTKPELYDLAADRDETTDVAAKHPEVMTKLLGYAETARADLGDSLTGRKGTGVREPGRLPGPKAK